MTSNEHRSNGDALITPSSSCQGGDPTAMVLQMSGERSCLRLEVPINAIPFACKKILNLMYLENGNECFATS
jgi:hypothetical protein